MRIRAVVLDSSRRNAERRVVDVVGFSDTHVAVVELQIELRAQGPNHTGDQLIRKGGFATAVGFGGIGIRGQNAAGADAAAERECPLRCDREVVGGNAHQCADGDVSIRIGNDASAYTGGAVHFVLGVAGFQFEAKSGGQFVTGRNIEPGSIRKADGPAGSTDRAIQECDARVERLQAAPAGADTEIIAVSGSVCRRGECQE